MAETKKLIYRNDNDEVVVDNSLEGNKVVLYEDEFVKIATTGHFYDFIATVENKDSEAITIVFEGESEFVVDFVVDGNDWVGILADEEGWDALVAICAGDFHIEGGDDLDEIDETEILATLKSTNISSVDLDRDFCNRVISLIENKNAQVVELEKKLKTEKEGCPYCKESKPLFWCDNYNEHAIREVYVELDGTMTVNTNIDDVKENFENSRFGLPETAKDNCNFPISFCPMCGRPLHKEDGENNG